MKEVSSKELNEAAMHIILHAGNCRNLLNQTLKNIEDGKIDHSEIKQLIDEAKKEITIAHKIQTDMIQSTIENDELKTTLLFTHAQDTLMTINSEMIMTQHLIKLYESLYTMLHNAEKES